VYYEVLQTIVVRLGARQPSGHRCVRVASDILLIAIGILRLVLMHCGFGSGRLGFNIRLATPDANENFKNLKIHHPGRWKLMDVQIYTDFRWWQ
jgi:hypothetical protein